MGGTYRRSRDTSRKRFHASITLKGTTLVDGENENDIFACLESFFEDWAVLFLGGPDAIVDTLQNVFFVEGLHDEVSRFCLLFVSKPICLSIHSELLPFLANKTS